MCLTLPLRHKVRRGRKYGKRANDDNYLSSRTVDSENFQLRLVRQCYCHLRMSRAHTKQQPISFRITRMSFARVDRRIQIGAFTASYGSCHLQHYHQPPTIVTLEIPSNFQLKRGKNKNCITNYVITGSSTEHTIPMIFIPSAKHFNTYTVTQHPLLPFVPETSAKVV